jgi:NAD(P)-dependent dehydrogenase (short-subunit alcohol dehydrogenase family)
LGLALAKDLVHDGWEVVIDGRHAGALQRAVAEIGGGVGQVRAIPGDVRDAQHRAALVAAAESSGGIDLLVNNASVLGPSPQPRLADYPLDVLEDVYRANVVAPLGLIQAALPLVAAAGGAIVNITSDAAVEGYEGWGGYGSSKAALEQLSNVLAAERPDVRVYWFDPGDMRTQMHQEAFPGEDISDRPEPETVVPALRRLLGERPPSGRYRAADLTATVAP